MTMVTTVTTKTRKGIEMTREKLFPFACEGRVTLLNQKGVEIDSVVPVEPHVTKIANTVLAENISVVFLGGDPPNIDIEFDWLCPNCGERHWALERQCQRLISCIGFRLRCGEVRIRFPWTRTRPRQPQSIYQKSRSGRASYFFFRLFSLALRAMPSRFHHPKAYRR